jgi:hypothetical protein
LEVQSVEIVEEAKQTVTPPKVQKKGSGWADRLKSKFDLLLLDENTVRDFEDLK